jgi:hypothetical protein
MTAPPTFADVLAPWHDFYLLAGTVSATLMGLLFVAMSIHWDVVLHDTKAHLHAIALEAFGSFIVVTFLALMMLSPVGTGRPIGLGLVVLGAMRLLIALRQSRQIWGGKAEDESFSKRGVVLRASLVPLAFAFLTGAGAFIYNGQLDLGISLLVGAVFVLLAMGARASWDLLVLVGRYKMKRDQRIS